MNLLKNEFFFFCLVPYWWSSFSNVFFFSFSEEVFISFFFSFWGLAVKDNSNALLSRLFRQHRTAIDLAFFSDFASWRSKLILFSFFFFPMLTSVEFSPQNTFFSPFFQLCLLHQRDIVSLWFVHAVFFFPLLFSRFVYFSFPLFSEIDARFCSFGTFNITFVAQHILYLFFPQPSAPTVALRLSTLFLSFSFCSVFLQPVFFFSRQATFSLSFDSLQWLFPSLLDRCSL